MRGAKVPLEFVATNGGKITGSTSQLVKKGGTASAVTAVPNEGFVFAGWTASSGGSYESATISFTMPQNADAGGVVLTAHFTADKHEHDYVEVEGTKTNPTCLKAGSAKYKCKICGEVVEKEIKALGHDWDAGVQKGNEIVYTCKREGCNTTKTEPIKATPTPSPTAAPTTAPTAVPTTPPTQPPHEHNYQLESETAATCGADGSRVYKCSCGDTKTETIPATGAHNWQETSRQEPQVGVAGSITYTCTGCGKTESKEIPALDPPPAPDPVPDPEPNPDSGDNNSGGGESNGEPQTASTDPEPEA